MPFFGWIRTYNIRECLLPDLAVRARTGGLGQFAQQSASPQKGPDTVLIAQHATQLLQCIQLSRGVRCGGVAHAAGAVPPSRQVSKARIIRPCVVFVPLAPAQAGLSVAAMVVPQGMSYAQNLAFLPQVYGLCEWL